MVILISSNGKISHGKMLYPLRMIFLRSIQSISLNSKKNLKGIISLDIMVRLNSMKLYYAKVKLFMDKVRQQLS